MTTALDRIFLGVLTLLILGTPFAIGSVPPKSYSLMEAAIFLLVVVWMLKLLLISREQGAGSAEWGTNKSETPNSSLSTPSSMLRAPRFWLTSDLRPLTSGVLPLILFVVVVLFQLVPIPPSVMRILSPHTYEFYSKIFFNWPEQPPYADLPVAAEQGAGSVGATGGRPQSPERDAKNAIDATNAKNAELLQSAKREAQSVPVGGPRSVVSGRRDGFTATWLPLSVAPYLTKIDLLKLIAYGALFFLILRYPYGAAWERGNTEPSPLGNLSPDQRLMRWIVWTVLSSGFLVAFVGFIQRFTWNGKILWFYEHWGYKPVGAGVITRASGPFVNPDHFANYLALVLPIALACTLFRSSLAGKDWQPTLRILAGCTAFLIFTGILLSLSRGALVAVCTGIAVLAWLAPWGAVSSRRQEQRAKRKGQTAERDHAINATNAMNATNGPPSATGHQPSAISHQPFAIRHFVGRGFAVGRVSVVIFCALLIVGLYFAGPSGRDQVDARLGERFVDEISLGGRSQIWRDSPKLIADFPLFGVGLGAWPEVFLRYRTDPWALNFFREAHNDYVQLLSEAGIAGFALFGWFIFAHGRGLVQGLKNISSRYLPLVAAMLAALAGMALHEWFDFNLKIPANAFLFIVLFAFALRAVTSPELRARSREHGAGSEDRGEFRNSDSDVFTAEAPRTRRQKIILTLRSLRLGGGLSGLTSGLRRSEAQIRNPKFEIRNSKSEIGSGSLLRAPCSTLRCPTPS